MEDTRRRLRRWIALLVALAGIAAFAIPAIGAPTKEVTVDPGAAAGAPGLTDLDSLTYAQAKRQLDKLSTITLPVTVPGLEKIGVSNVTLGSNDAGRSVSLSGSAKLPALHGGGQSVDLLVTATWPDDASTEPVIAIAAKTDDLTLSDVNSLWNAGDARFTTARVAISTADQDISPDALPAAARAFFPEPTRLTGGVNFSGELALEGRLAEVFAYTGHSGTVALEGSLSASAAALFGHATNAQLGGLRLKATLEKSPTAPNWLAERTSTYEFSTAGLTLDEAVTVALDGKTNRFTGRVAIPRTGEIEGEFALVGNLDAPYGLNALSDVKLRLSRGGGALGFSVDVDGSPIAVNAELISTGADFSVRGELTAPRLAALGGKLLGTPVSAVPGAEDVKLNGSDFSISRGVFSVHANATVKGLNADAVLTLRGRQPLLALRVDNVRLSTLIGETATPGDIELPAVTLTATSLTELAAADLTSQERAFFGDALPDTLTFEPGLNLTGRLPLDALGLSELGSEVTLAGTIGPKHVALEAELDKLPSLPEWVEPTAPTTLGLAYDEGKIAASIDIAAEVTVNRRTFSTALSGSIERAGQRTSIDFHGEIAGWSQPFGVSWINSLDDVAVDLKTSFGGGQPSSLQAAVNASVTLKGHTFDLEFGLAKETRPTAKLTVGYEGELSLAKLVQALPALDGVAPNAKLGAINLDDVIGTLEVGGAESAFELEATTSFDGLDSRLLVRVRPGGKFALGVKPLVPVDLEDLGGVSLKLPAAVVVLSNDTAPRSKTLLSDDEFDFYKSLYGCAEAATRAQCTSFTALQFPNGLKLMAAAALDPKLTELAQGIGVQTGGRVLLEGDVPVFGGTKFAVTAKLGNLSFPGTAPDWFHSGRLTLEIGTDGIRFAGGLTVKIENQLLNFDVGVRVTREGLTLTGGMTGAWQRAFGQDWLTLSDVKLQLGVKLGAGPEVTMGFTGRALIDQRDVAIALKVGIAPAGPPPFRPNLIGFALVSKSGIALKDLAWLTQKVTGTDLKVSSLPDISLRNLSLQYSQQSDPDLCLTQGLRFNADLYLAPPLERDPADDASGCQAFETTPKTGGECIADKAEGCLASVYGRLDSGGLVAGGELNGFELGPIALEDSSIALALTPTQQRLRVKGGLRIATDDYEFAEGHADLDISKEGFNFAGDAQLFNEAFTGYLEASAPFDLEKPSFTVKAYLRADARSALGDKINTKAADIRPAIKAFGVLADVMRGGGSVANVRDLPQQFRNAGLPVPDGVQRMADVLSAAQTKVRDNDGPPVTFDPLLKGFSFRFAGLPGWREDNRCYIVQVGGKCWITPPFRAFPGAPEIPGVPGVWTDGDCVKYEVDGQCYLVEPTTVTVGGICEKFDVPVAECNWSELMRRVVRPALVEAIKSTTGVQIDPASLEASLKRLVDTFTSDSILAVDCAYFSADASRLAEGKVDVELAAKVRLFGQTVGVGAAWDFAAEDSPKAYLAAAIRSLLSPSGKLCPQMPTGHQEPGPGTPSKRLNATLTPTTFDQGGETTLRATFTELDVRGYPAVRVSWGDGSTTTLPAGDSRVVTQTHRYANDGPHPVTLTVQDDGAYTKLLTAFVRNVAPALTYLETDPLPGVEGDVVTVRGRFVDLGTADRHTVRIDWRDGTPAEVRTLETGARNFAIAHRYHDDLNDKVTVTVTDDAGEVTQRTAPVVLRSVAPSQVRVTPVSVLPYVTEGALATYAIEFTDPGERDPHTITIHWGDGEKQTAAVGIGPRRLELRHRYPADGVFTIKVAVADDDGVAETMVPTRVINVAPQVSAQLERSSIRKGEMARIAGTIADPGERDAATVTINWGAGATQTIALQPGERTFKAERRFADAGAFTVKVDVHDGMLEGAPGSLPLSVG